MSSVGEIIEKYLSIKQQLKVIDESLKNGQLEVVLEILTVSDIDISNQGSLVGKLFGIVEKSIREKLLDVEIDDFNVNEHTSVVDEQEIRILAQLIAKLDPLWKLFEKFSSDIISNYIIENSKKLFDHEYYSKQVVTGLITDREHDNGLNCPSIVLLLKLIEIVYVFREEEEGTFKSQHLNPLLIALLNSNIEIVSINASKLMRWATESIAISCNNEPAFDSFTWNTVRLLFNDRTNHDWKERNGLTFSLRYLSNNKIQQSTSFISYIKTDLYWRNLQNALNSDIHEYRKLGLSVLKLSIQLLNKGFEEFSVTSFTWIPKESNKIISMWQKFTTLYEIIALDTALNQFEAASSDVLEIFEDIIIYPGWSMILISTGLKATMESVRKYTMSLVFKIQNKLVFSSNIEILKETILPSIMQAHYYNTEGESCEHGDKVVNFINGLVTDNNDNRSTIIDTLLDILIEQRTSFDASRIYVSYGILTALKGKLSRILNSSDLSKIRKLFEFESEEEIAEITIQTIFLKFLLHTNNEISIIDWISTIVANVNCNNGSYYYISILLEDFKDYAITYFEQATAADQLFPLINENPVFDLFANILFNIPVPAKMDFITELSKAGEASDYFNEYASDILLRLATNKATEKEYENSYLLCQYKGFNSSIWNILDLSSLYDEIKEQFTVEKFKFFVTAYGQLVQNSIETTSCPSSEVFELYNTIKEHLNLYGQDQFKLKDETYSFYFSWLLHYFKTYALSFEENNNELKLLVTVMANNFNVDNGNYMANLKIVEVSKYLLENYAYVQDGKLVDNGAFLIDLFRLNESIWENIVSERLVLKQRELHLLLIETLYHPIMLLNASIVDKEMQTSIESIGLEIVKQGYSRRGFLPLITFNISQFLLKYNKMLTGLNSSFWWLTKPMLSSFTQQQMNFNVFKLKTTIAKLYDEHLAGYQSKGKNLYDQVYGKPELSARVYLVDGFLSMPPSIKEEFIEKVATETNLLVPIKRTDGSEALERLFQWELMVACMSSISKEKLISLSNTFVLDSIVDESSPLVRIYKEWFIAYELVTNYSNTSSSTTEDYLFDHMINHSKPILVVSVERIIYITLKALLDQNESKFDRLLNRFISTLLPNASSNKPLVRHFSNSLMLSFWPAFESLISDVTLRAVLEGLYKNSKRTELTGQYRSGDANVWELKKDLTLTNVFGVLLRKITDHEPPYIPEELFSKYLNNKTAISIGKDEKCKWLKKRENLTQTKTPEEIESKTTQLQTKSGAWETVLDIDSEKSDRSVTRSDLIVVSSLVDKPPNLGGICRLCDVLGVGLLTVQDIRVKNHPQFKNVAVTADRWMPMEEVPIDGIIEFMRAKKKEGYTLIGLEQTDKSIQLNNKYTFPKKSLILLGTEAHGIPGHLLSELDLCLEIEQHGVIRSMNIQTATAVIVYSYTVQHM
ncbi:hypothetical protein Kpol_1043p27 [Vanderwaltozyma polyspora DSM 70294]|uniref:tRNA/rRNA methyltransferase SpoU type domain-containing protein n=1 Tax=Vanderwaltozyma polyspora (strain ATCC 22028 / DSM 70294 / BCRC 21397 / CBS 2163 / NBRC 10782 / NRRL Y-8283 / UCD 57-17) TaxID=436907 RepID=A7TIP5_VANPO|nr:uncharacterized protein Kpol_1043p27 [Vanderwaltozyma polyspora DSM 70294]EDO17837.1 hypothetical protein Kpol_1043p27 [Vanderwaltozyma polyspora DSM 70294]